MAAQVESHPGIIARGARAVRRDGAAGTARRALGRVGQAAHLREQHFWYELRLDSDYPRRPIPDGLELVRASGADVALIAGLGESVDQAREFHEAGNDLWMVLEGRSPLFSCWIFRERAPAIAARGGWLELPAGAVCLESSITSPRARGRGIGPAAWSGIADRLAAEGLSSMVTKVEITNVPSRRAVAKAGFREVGLMTLVRVGPRTRVRVEPFDRGMGQDLAERLRR